MQMKAKANGGNADQHNQLMDEFKKAHQKMFKNGNRTVEDDLVSVTEGLSTFRGQYSIKFMFI